MHRSAPQQDETPVIISLGRPWPRRRSRTTIALVGLLALAVGIGGWMHSRADAADDRLLVVDDTGAISLLDPETGEAVFEVPGATATPDRSALLTTATTGDHTVLESRDPVTGLVTGSTRLDGGGLTVRTVSPQGQAVALMPGPRGSGRKSVV